MSGWRLVALLLTPPLAIIGCALATVCGAIIYVTRES